MCVWEKDETISARECCLSGKHIISFPRSESSEEESACAREEQSNTKAEKSVHAESGEITHSCCFTNTRKSL